MRPKVLLLDEPHPKARAIMEEVAECYSKEEAQKTFTEAYMPTTIIYTQLTPVPEYVALPVFCPCTGIDHIQSPKVIYLDKQWKANEGQQVTSTAEHTWSLILRLAKTNRIQLHGKTLGIIGYGRIGQQVTEYAIAFEMQCVLCESKYNRTASTEETLKLSDIVTIHVPLNDETRGMIGEKEFDMMKPGTLLINTSRAEIVDEEALYNALTNNKIAGYADDFRNDHTMVTEYFENIGKAIMTDHIAGNCLEAREATDIYIAKQIVEYLKGDVNEHKM